jgi:hypothetical protein
MMIRNARLFLAALVAATALPALGQQPTPRDPKSPIPDHVDGRGPTGPVQLKILAPKPDEVIPMPPAAPGQPPPKGAVVEVKFELQNYEAFQDPKTQSGQGIGIVFDNGSVSVDFHPDKPWVFRHVPKGTHTIRAFAVRPWHEALKEPGAFAMVTFHVGEKDGKNTPEAGAPLLVANRPKGKYPKGEAHKVMLDFLVRNCVVGDKDVPGSCRVRYRIDELPEVTLTKEEPVFLTDLPPGKHLYVIALTKDDKIVEGPFNLYRGSFEIVGEAAPAVAPPAPSTAAPAPPKAGEPAP